MGQVCLTVYIQVLRNFLWSRVEGRQCLRHELHEVLQVLSNKMISHPIAANFPMDVKAPAVLLNFARSL
jgi:hypothetical protein